MSLKGVTGGAVPPDGVLRVKSASATGRVEASLKVQVITGPATVLPTTAEAGWLGAAVTVETLGNVTRAVALCSPGAAKVRSLGPGMPCSASALNAARPFPSVATVSPVTVVPEGSAETVTITPGCAMGLPLAS